MIGGWEDYEPTDAVEVVGLALIAAGVSLPDPAGGPGVLMDRQTAGEVLEALLHAGYRVIAPGMDLVDGDAKLRELLGDLGRFVLAAEGSKIRSPRNRASLLRRWSNLL